MAPRRSATEAASATSAAPDLVAEGVAARFVRALAAKDAGALAAQLDPEVDFAALTPGRSWDAHDAGGVVDTMLGTWFSPEREIVETLAVQTDKVAALQRMAYRFRVVRPDGEFVIEQQAYYRADRERIGWLRIMCSGFLPQAEPGP